MRRSTCSRPGGTRRPRCRRSPERRPEFACRRSTRPTARSPQCWRQRARSRSQGDDDDPETSPTEWPWVQALMAETDPARQIAGFATHIRTTAPKAGPLVAEIRSAARSDPDLREVPRPRGGGAVPRPVGVAGLLAAEEHYAPASTSLAPPTRSSRSRCVRGVRAAGQRAGVGRGRVRAVARRHSVRAVTRAKEALTSMPPPR